MALQDLTPQLRTRLSRLERVVGFFVIVAALLLLAGLAFYIYRTAERKGWFLRKLPYYTFARSAAGLKIGQPVKLMGLDVGEIVDIQPQPPEDSYYDMFVAFWVKEPYYGYLWEDSRARIGATDFLGNRFIELTKGTNGPSTYLFRPFREVPLSEMESILGDTPVLLVDEIYDETKQRILGRPMQPVTSELLQRIVAAGSVATLRVIDTTNYTKRPVAMWDFKDAHYQELGRDTRHLKGYFLVPDESQPLTERLEAVVDSVQAALPGVLRLTNQIQRVLDNAALAAAHADELLDQARPVLANVTEISRHLTNGQGSLGEWLLPPGVTPQLTQTLASANLILTNSDARVTMLALELDRTLEHLAGITGNLHAQVDANTNLVREIARLIVNTDDMIQGLKRHWLLRSAFKGGAARPPPREVTRPARAPNDPRP
jgi:hypothetical protein